MFLPGLCLDICLLCLSFNSKPTIAIFTSGSSMSMTLKEWDDVILLAIVALTWWLRMQHHTDIEEMPLRRKVCHPYAVRTQNIHLDTPIIKIIRSSIASYTLWIRKVRHRYAVTTLHMPHVRDRYTYRIVIAYQAIKLRSCYVHAVLLSF